MSCCTRLLSVESDGVESYFETGGFGVQLAVDVFKLVVLCSLPPFSDITGFCMLRDAPGARRTRRPYGAVRTSP
jgi:hypothetical protein